MTTTPFTPHTFFNDGNPEESSRGAKPAGAPAKGSACRGGPVPLRRWWPGPAAATGAGQGWAAPPAAAGRWPPPPPSRARRSAGGSSGEGRAGLAALNFPARCPPPPSPRRGGRDGFLRAMLPAAAASSSAASCSVGAGGRLPAALAR